MSGIFITIEGPDGAGKTTQRELLKEYLEKKGYDVLITRDPGGNPISEAIREVILNKEFTEMGYMTFLMDLNAQEGIARKKNQAELDRMENEKIEFHQKVVDGYRMLADMHPERIVKIDATLPINEIHGIITEYVEKKLNL